MEVVVVIGKRVRVRKSKGFGDSGQGIKSASCVSFRLCCVMFSFFTFLCSFAPFVTT